MPSCECPWASSYILYGLTASSAWRWVSFCKRCRILCRACRSCTSRDFRSTRRQDRQTLPHGILLDCRRISRRLWRRVFHSQRAGCLRSSGISFDILFYAVVGGTHFLRWGFRIHAFQFFIRYFLPYLCVTVLV